MPRGGARNRSGPPPDPTSGRSDRRGFSLQDLPASGYDGPAPDFPLLRHRVYRWEQDGKTRVQVLDAEASEEFAEREAELWAWAWTTPQACAWSMASEAWRINTIAMWVRTFVICETSQATAADKNSLHRFADQIGMTTAGLAEMGWRIKPDELAKRAAEQDAEDESAEEAPRRLSAVRGA